MYSIEVKGINSPVVYTRLCIDIIQTTPIICLSIKWQVSTNSSTLNTGSLKCQ